MPVIFYFRSVSYRKTDPGKYFKDSFSRNGNRVMRSKSTRFRRKCKIDSLPFIGACFPLHDFSKRAKLFFCFCFELIYQLPEFLSKRWLNVFHFSKQISEHSFLTEVFQTECFNMLPGGCAECFYLCN